MVLSSISSVPPVIRPVGALSHDRAVVLGRPEWVELGSRRAHQVHGGPRQPLARPHRQQLVERPLGAGFHAGGDGLEGSRANGGQVALLADAVAMSRRVRPSPHRARDLTFSALRRSPAASAEEVRLAG